MLKPIYRWIAFVGLSLCSWSAMAQDLSAHFSNWRLSYYSYRFQPYDRMLRFWTGGDINTERSANFLNIAVTSASSKETQGWILSGFQGDPQAKVRITLENSRVLLTIQTRSGDSEIRIPLELARGFPFYYQYQSQD